MSKYEADPLKKTALEECPDDVKETDCEILGKELGPESFSRGLVSKP